MAKLTRLSVSLTSVSPVNTNVSPDVASIASSGECIRPVNKADDADTKTGAQVKVSAIDELSNIGSEDFKTMKSEMAHLKVLVSGLVNEIAFFKRKSNEYETSLTTVEGQIALIKSKINNHEDSLSLVDGQVDSIQNSADEHRACLSILDVRIVSTENQLNEHGPRLSSVEDTLKWIRPALTKLEQDMATVKDYVGEVNAEVAEDHKTFEELKAKVNKEL